MEVTLEQDLKLRQLADLLETADKKDIISVYLALQKQNFCLANTVTNLVKQWPQRPLLTTPAEQ